MEVMQDELLTRISLLRRVKDPQDHDSWQEFVRCYAPLVARWASRRGLQADDVEEANCRVLMRLFEYLPHFEYDADRGRFRGYLFQTLRSVVSEIFREKRNAGLLPEANGQFLLEIQSNPEACEDLLSELVEEHRYHQYRQAKIRAKKRCDKSHVWESWTLTREQQFSPSEAAAKMQIKLSSVYMNISRVNEYIREEYDLLDQT